MSTSTNLSLPYIVGEQALKHITHNEALKALDAIVQLSVIDRDLATPPTSPSNGDRYIVGSSPTGDWISHEDEVAAFQDGVWVYYTPQTGWQAWIADEAAVVAWNGTAWMGIGGGSVNPTALVGVNTTADATNKLSVKSDVVLFSHDDVTPGSGDMRASLNKASSSNSVSMLFQSNWSGHAEFGLTGDNDWRVKVSPDGAVWNDALIADRTTGQISFPQGTTHSSSGAPVGQFIFTPGGDGVVSIYRIDQTTVGLPRQASISTVISDVITLTANVAGQFFSPMMRDVSYVRIWNTSKSPEQPAWVKYDPTANQLQVTDASHISGWLAGETIQVGDPTSLYPAGVAALDISPMMINLFGQPFPQKGIVARSELLGANQGDAIRLSVDGQPGSDVIGARCQDTNTPSAGDGVVVLACTEPSPISNSNLVLVMEQFSSTAGIRLFSSLALFG